MSKAVPVVTISLPVNSQECSVVCRDKSGVVINNVATIECYPKFARPESQVSLLPAAVVVEKDDTPDVTLYQGILQISGASGRLRLHETTVPVTPKFLAE